MDLAPKIVVRQVVLLAAGKLSTGTITPTATKIPTGILAADVVNTAAWTITDVAGGVEFPVLADEVRHLPGGFVNDAIFAAGTYKILFYVS